MRISDWSSDVCSSYLFGGQEVQAVDEGRRGRRAEDAGSTRARTAKARQRSARARARADAQLIGITPRRPAHVRYRIFRAAAVLSGRSEEHTSELQSLMRISYAVFCLKKKKDQKYVSVPLTLCLIDIKHTN